VGVVIQFVVTLAVPCGILYLFVRRNRERDENAPLRDDIEAGASFVAPLHRARVLGTGGFGGTRGMWISLRGPKRLAVSADAFLVSAPQALREYVFTGRDSSIALSRSPSGVVDREWVVITRPDVGRELRLAITGDNLPEIWTALAGTGATPAPELAEPEPAGTFTSALGRVRGWRRVALGFGFVVIFALLPALVDLIGRHMR